MKHASIFASAACILATSAHAGVSVKIERLNPANPAWKFLQIPGPSKSDVAQDAKITVTGNQLESTAGAAAVLVNGKLPNNANEISEEALLANNNGNDGTLTLDLGKAQPIAAVSSYSWHENPADQGCRGPQLYTLSGSLDGQNWTKIADVDTRPNTTGQNWNGQHGAFISDDKGNLGDFRYLKFDIKRTRSPLQANAAMTATLFSEIDVHTKATLAKAGDATIVGPTQVTDIWVVFKTHCDLGYTKTFDAVNDDYRGPMMDNAIRLMEADRAKPAEERFKWTIGGWPMERNILGPKQDPARKAKIDQGIREGAFDVHALPASLHTESMDLEDLVRGLGYSSKVARDHGKPLPIAAKMSDVPCHAWILPSLLSHAGVKFLHIGANYANRTAIVPKIFWWEGPDGSRILCGFNAEYGSPLTPPKGWPAKNYLAVLMTHDNEGPPSPQVVDAVRAAVAKMPGVKLHFATMDDFTKAILAEKPELPVIRGDMVDPWIHGISSMPQETGMMRVTRPMLTAMEMLDTNLRTWNLQTPDIAPPLAQAYEDCLLYGEHTFGAMTPGYGFWSTGMPGRFFYGQAFHEQRAKGFYKKFEASFEPKRGFATQANSIATNGLKTRLDLLARSVKADGKRIVVFNPLPWKRSGMVEVDGHRYFAKDVPAGGYVTLKDPSDSPQSSDLTAQPIETAHFKITLDLQRGGISSLVEKATGRELVDRSSPYALGQFLHEKFSNQQTLDYFKAYCTMDNSFNASTKPGMPKDQAYEAISPSNWTGKVTRSSLEDSITLTAGDTKGLAKTISLTFTFPAHQATMETTWKMDDKVPDTIPEGGWICYPLAVENPEFLLGRLGGVMDLAKDQITGGNRYLYGIQSGVAVVSPKRDGVGLCAIDAPLMSFGVPGLWKYDKDYLPKTPTVFVHLHNNMWNTNFPYWTEGDLTSRVKLWPIQAGQASPLATQPWEARVPLLAAVADGPAGKLPTTQSGVTVSRPGVLVTAFGPNPDGPGTVLRVWDQTGASGAVTVTLPGKFTEAVPVNLRGERLELTRNPIKLQSNQLSFTLKGNEPASFLLK